MTVLSGVGALAITLLAFGWAYGAFRRPVPKTWTDSEGVAMGVCLGLTALVAVSLGLMGQVAIQYDTVLAEIGPAGFAAALVVLISSVALARLLMAPARRHADTTAQVRVEMPKDIPAPANDNGVASQIAA